MKLADVTTGMQSLLDAPSPAVLTLYRADGEALTAPVWYRVHDGALQVVVAINDPKLEHLRRDPRCVLLVFETIPPFRGVQVRGRAALTTDEGAQARLAIASRYLGADRGRAFADIERRPPGVVISLSLGDARAWDLRAALED